MFGSLYFRGCKYTNKILFINKNIVFQHFVLLITCHLERFPVRPGMTREPFSVISTGFLSVISTERSEWRISTPGVPPRKTQCHPSRSATTDRPTTFGANSCRTVPKTAAKHPKTGPSIMFFDILMSDGLKVSIFRKKSARDKRIFL